MTIKDIKKLIEEYNLPDDAAVVIEERELPEEDAEPGELCFRSLGPVKFLYPQLDKEAYELITKDMAYKPSKIVVFTVNDQWDPEASP